MNLPPLAAFPSWEDQEQGGRSHRSGGDVDVLQLVNLCLGHPYGRHLGLEPLHRHQPPLPLDRHPGHHPPTMVSGILE